jgi:hypothetical protein
MPHAGRSVIHKSNEFGLVYLWETHAQGIVGPRSPAWRLAGRSCPQITQILADFWASTNLRESAKSADNLQP